VLRRWARRLLVALLGVLVIAAAVVVAARAFGWQAGPLYFLVALTPYVGVACLLAALLSALLREWWPAVVAVVLAGVVAAWWIPAFLPAPADPGGTDLRVMTANLQFGRADPDAVVAAVGEQRVDLLALEELTPQARSGLRRAGLDRLLPHHSRGRIPTPVAPGSGPATRCGIAPRPMS
jgi:hypothetical protein